MEGAFHTSNSLLKFLKLIAKQESEYARTLLGSSRDDKKLFQTCNGTVGFAWLMMFNGSTANATERQSYALALRENVCNVLAERLESLNADFKAAEAEGYRGVNEKALRAKGSRRGNQPVADSGASDDSKANSVITAALRNISVIERRRIDCTNLAMAQYMDLTRKFQAASSESLKKIADAFHAVNVEEDEVALCAKIASEAQAYEAGSGAGGSAGMGGGGDEADGSLAVMKRNFDRMKKGLAGEGDDSIGNRLGRLANFVKKSGSEGIAAATKKTSKPKLVNSQQGVFGVGLEEFMNRQRGLYPNLDVPVWLPIFRDTLMKLGGAKSEGIFRISGGAHACNMHKEMLCAPLKFASAPGAGDGSKQYFRGIRLITSIPVVTSTFKSILRELPVPVVPHDLYNVFVDGQYPKTLTAENFEEKVLNLINPVSHRNTFIFVIGFAQYLTQFAAETKMGASNLAMIFGPCLLRCPTENPAMLLKYYDLEKMFMQACINLMPKHFYTDLNTTPEVRPDGSKYDGKGFEMLANDPLAAKHSIVVPENNDEPEVEVDVPSYTEEPLSPPAAVSAPSTQTAQPGAAPRVAKPLPTPAGGAPGAPTLPPKPVPQVPKPQESGLEQPQDQSEQPEQQPEQQQQEQPSMPRAARLNPASATQMRLANELTLRMGRSSGDAEGSGDAGSGGSAGGNKLAMKQTAAQKEIERIRATYSSILTALEQGNLDGLQAFASCTETLANTLDSFSGKNLGCSESKLIAIQEAPDFTPIALYEKKPQNARQEAMIAKLCDSAKTMHVQLLYIKAHIMNVSSAIDASLICDTVRGACNAYSSGVTPYLTNDGTKPAPKGPAGMRPLRPVGEGRGRPPPGSKPPTQPPGDSRKPTPQGPVSQSQKSLPQPHKPLPQGAPPAKSPQSQSSPMLKPRPKPSGPPPAGPVPHKPLPQQAHKPLPSASSQPAAAPVPKPEPESIPPPSVPPTEPESVPSTEPLEIQQQQPPPPTVVDEPSDMAELVAELCPEMKLRSSLLGFSVEVEDARMEGEQAIQQYEQGVLSKEEIADFVRRVRPFIVYENELLNFAKQHSVNIEALPVPSGDPNSLQTKLQLLLFHLSKCSMLLNCVVKFIQISQPLDPSLVDALTNLVNIGETLIEC